MAIKEFISFFSDRIPGQLVIQYTNECNASCPQCGMRRSNPFIRTKLGLNEVKKIIDHAAKNDVIAISFTGGEPFLFFDEIIELIHYASAAGIKYIRTGTNGFYFTNSQRPAFEEKITKIARTLAETKIYTFWISVDSSIPSMHERMRGLEGVIDGIRKALPIFHHYGIYPSANLGINRNVCKLNGVDVSDNHLFYKAYREAFRNFYHFVIDLGFTMVNACYPMSIDSEKDSLDAVYSATSKANVINFTSEEKAVIFKALFHTIPEFRSKIRIFSPLVSLYSLILQHEGSSKECFSCRGGKDFFFVDAKDGDTYPCGYRGKENFGKFWDLDLKKIKQFRRCIDCDWECFRDPSELLGPFLTLCRRPISFFENLFFKRQFMGLWYRDLKYYKACDFFNGRRAPNFKKLSSF